MSSVWTFSSPYMVQTMCFDVLANNMPCKVYYVDGSNAWFFKDAHHASMFRLKYSQYLISEPEEKQHVTLQHNFQYD